MPGLSDAMREFVRSSEFLSLLRKPSVARFSAVNLGNFSGLTSTTWAAVDARLSVTIECSGRRPVRVAIGAMALGSAAPIALSVLWDSTEVTGSNAGMAQTIGTSLESLTGSDLIMAPTRGPHRVILAYRMSGGAGTVYCDANTRIMVYAEELGSV